MQKLMIYFRLILICMWILALPVFAQTTNEVREQMKGQEEKILMAAKKFQLDPNLLFTAVHLMRQRASSPTNFLRMVPSLPGVGNLKVLKGKTDSLNGVMTLASSVKAISQQHGSSVDQVLSAITTSPEALREGKKIYAQISATGFFPKPVEAPKETRVEITAKPKEGGEKMVAQPKKPEAVTKVVTKQSLSRPTPRPQAAPESVVIPAPKIQVSEAKKAVRSIRFDLKQSR